MAITAGGIEDRVAEGKRLIARLRECGVPEERFQGIETGDGAGRRSEVHLILGCFRDGLIEEADYLSLLTEAASLAVRAHIEPEEIDPRFAEVIPIHYARRFQIIGLRAVGGVMPLVTADPSDASIAGYVGALLGTPVRWELARGSVVQQAINAVYATQESDFSGVLSERDVLLDAEPGADDEDLLNSASRAPVIKLVNMLLFEAVKREASDVHVQPYATHVKARFRIDGVLYDFLDIPVNMLDEVVSRIKVIGKMDIAEKRIAQDGRTTVTVGERQIDLRISIIPTCHGERAVLRLLDKSARLFELGELGMSAADRERFAGLIRRTHGIILVTGPTGSGKSTTLYAALLDLDCGAKNILTLEDPIEYRLAGISQMQVSSKKGMTFATGLRAVLRQDPDIIMVGEIRDEETARMAVQSSLTGHLVLSTLHTNNAAGAVSRLLDLGIEPYLVASSLIASVAQRLVRVVCPYCSREEALSGEEARGLGVGWEATFGVDRGSPPVRGGATGGGGEDRGSKTGSGGWSRACGGDACDGSGQVGGAHPTEVGGAHPTEVGGAHPTEVGMAHPTEVGMAHPTEVGMAHPTEFGVVHHTRGAGAVVRGAVGCEWCSMTGYRGRRGVFELLVVDEAIRELIVQRAKSSAIERCAMAAGMRTLRQDAYRKLSEGVTTLEEVSRVTNE
jgi:general secretion pathway protein E